MADCQRRRIATIKPLMVDGYGQFVSLFSAVTMLGTFDDGVRRAALLSIGIRVRMLPTDDGRILSNPARVRCSAANSTQAIWSRRSRGCAIGHGNSRSNDYTAIGSRRPTTTATAVTKARIRRVASRGRTAVANALTKPREPGTVRTQEIWMAPRDEHPVPISSCRCWEFHDEPSGWRFLPGNRIRRAVKNRVPYLRFPRRDRSNSGIPFVRTQS